MSKFIEIEAFIQVAQQGSFTRAAEHLELSRGRISQLIARLESRLGVTLLHRTTRSMQLTNEGEQYLAACRLGMSQLDSAEANLKMMSQRLSGPVRVNAVGGIYGETFLAQALAELVTEHPELNVSIDYSSQLIDLNKDPFDLVMRIGHAPAADVESMFLCEVHHTLCASPSFINQHGFLEHPEQLSVLPTVCGTPKIWELEHIKTERKQVVTPNAHWRSGSTQAQLIAVEAGLGVGRILSWVAEPKLQQGKLLSLLPDWRVEPTYLWLMWPKQPELPKRTQIVRDHLVHKLTSISASFIP